MRSDYIAIYKNDRGEYLLYDCDISEDKEVIYYHGWTMIDAVDDEDVHTLRNNDKGENFTYIFELLEKIT